jgi:hypothetical protein
VEGGLQSSAASGAGLGASVYYLLSMPSDIPIAEILRLRWWDWSAETITGKVKAICSGDVAALAG